MSTVAPIEGYELSEDPARLDVDLIHDVLSRSYWSPGIHRSVVERAIAHSLCFGIYLGCDQVGFARVITDRASFAYLADVFVLEAHRGQGLAQWLVQTIQAHEDLRRVRRFLLVTRDAHALYRRCGFVEIDNPGRFMECYRADAHQSPL